MTSPCVVSGVARAMRPPVTEQKVTHNIHCTCLLTLEKQIEFLTARNFELC